MLYVNQFLIMSRVDCVGKECHKRIHDRNEIDSMSAGSKSMNFMR